MSKLFRHELVIYSTRKDFFDVYGLLKDPKKYVDRCATRVELPNDMSGNVRGHFDIPQSDIPHQSTFSWEEIPSWNRPKYSIGDPIGLYAPKHKSDYRFYAEELLRSWGHMRVREFYMFLQCAEELQITVIAIEPYYSQVTHGIANQCYLENGQPHSGLTWHYKVLITGLHRERRLAVVPDVWIQESALER
jgi:hypothetical protein